MTPQAKLNHIELKGFRSIHELSLDLNSLNILVGPNGVGDCVGNTKVQINILIPQCSLMELYDLFV